MFGINKMQSFGDLMKAYLLLNTLLASSSAPLLLNDKWLNMFIIMVVTPLVITALPRGGDIFGRLAIDAPFLMVSTLLGMGMVAGVSQINKRFEKDFRDYGKTTKSTGTVLGLRPVCLLFGFLDAVAARLQGVEVPGIGAIPVQFIQALPSLLTVILLAGFIGRALAPKASGVPYAKER